MDSHSDNREVFLVWVSGFLLVLMVHLVWQLLNQAPPAWDMAFHQLKGWQLAEIWREGGPVHAVWSVSFPYPPLYHWTEALILSLLGDTRLLAFLTNLPGLFLLSYGTYRVGLFYLGSVQATWAGILVLLFPMVAWVSRESLLDVPLAGWVAFAGFLILKSRYFTIRSWVLLLGLVCAAGMLTKWTFPIYLLFPILYGIFRSPLKVRSFLNLMIAGILALPLVLIYYGPNFKLLFSNYPTTEQAGLIPWLPFPRHGEPGLNNYLGWIYYPRVLASYFLFLPLTLLFLLGSLLPKEGPKSAQNEGRGYLWFWLVGGILLLTLLTPKDPRFAIPLATPLAILLVLFWKSHRRIPMLLFGVAILQFLLVSFHTPLTPPKLAVLGIEEDGDFQSIQKEWVAFQPEYFGITGPPRRENWRFQEILSEIPEGSLVGFLPELPRFNVNGLSLQATRKGRKLSALALGSLENWQEQLKRLDFVVAKSGDQGLSFITGFNSDIEGMIKAEQWDLAGEWGLPDNSNARLLKNPHHEPKTIAD
jgi:hypothetical protein